MQQPYGLLALTLLALIASCPSPHGHFDSSSKDSEMSEDKCPICLEFYVQSTPIWRWPCCHKTCLACVANFLTDEPDCPVCRHPWGGYDHTLAFRDACGRIGLRVEGRRNNDPGVSTEVDPVPEPLQHIVPLCHPRVALDALGNATELLDRRMAWFPVRLHF